MGERVRHPYHVAFTNRDLAIADRNVRIPHRDVAHADGHAVAHGDDLSCHELEQQPVQREHRERLRA